MHTALRRCTPGTLCLVLSTLLASLFSTGCADTSTADSSFGDQVAYKPSREAIDARVEADGTYFTTRLEISGHRGERTEVRIYGDNGKLLGFRYATPDYDDTVWEKFSIFVPRDHLHGMHADAGIDLYVVAPNDPDHYIGHDRFDKSNLSSPEVLWDWVQYRDGTTLSSGKPGMTITVSLEIDGHKNQSVETCAVVTDLQLNEIDAPNGGPVRIPGPTLKPTYDNSFYDSLTFEIPYDALRKIPPNVRVKITPCVKIDDQIVLGNIHFITWAGGTSDDVRKKIQSAVDDYQKQADQLQYQIDALQREAGR